jgi:uncharacterized protein (TIGR02145 family)
MPAKNLCMCKLLFRYLTIAVLISSFIALNTNAQTPTTVKDIDGFEYKIIRLGGQTWMAQNLNVTRFRNGDPIMEATTPEEWKKADMERIPAWCYYENDPANGPAYGKLYNWYAITDPRGLAPEKWRVPNSEEWNRLITNLGKNERAGDQLKDVSGWKNMGNGNNKSGFKALPGGNRSASGTFQSVRLWGYWWTSEEHASETAIGYDLGFSRKKVNRFAFRKGHGFSVRCVR